MPIDEPTSFTAPRASAFPATVRRWLSIARVALVTSAAACAPAMAAHPPANLTVVLVHGALTDASVWSEVTRQLQRKGYPVLAPAMPLRGLASDSAYLASFLKTVPGRVVLVGHSYGGAVITQAAPTTPNVVSLVYIAAFQPDSGETAGQLNAQFPGSKLGADTTTVRPYPNGNDLYLKPESFREVYAGDVELATAAAMAAMQRPIDPVALGEPLQGPPAWRTLPSWALVSTRDASIPTAALRFMAARAHSHTKEIESSHAAPVSHPAAVVELIEQAALASMTAYP